MCSVGECFHIQGRHLDLIRGTTSEAGHCEKISTVKGARGQCRGSGWCREQATLHDCNDRRMFLGELESKLRPEGS